MKKIILIVSLATFVFASTGKDIYDINNKAWIKDKQMQYSLKADGNKKVIKCIKSQVDEKSMKKCLKK